jgi:hypothetical protein
MKRSLEADFNAVIGTPDEIALMDLTPWDTDSDVEEVEEVEEVNRLAYGELEFRRMLFRNNYYQYDLQQTKESITASRDACLKILFIFYRGYVTFRQAFDGVYAFQFSSMRLTNKFLYATLTQPPAPYEGLFFTLHPLSPIAIRTEVEADVEAFKELLPPTLEKLNVERPNEANSEYAFRMRMLKIYEDDCGSLHELVVEGINNAAGFNENCRCLDPIVRALFPQKRDLALYASEKPCTHFHATVDFALNPLVMAPPYKWTVKIHHNNKTEEVYKIRKNFFCYPSFQTTDLITQSRLANSMICNKMACPNFTFVFNTKYPEIAARRYEVNEAIVRNVGRMMRPFMEMWWIEHVHTCEDVRFFYFLFCQGMEYKLDFYNDAHRH